MTRDPDSLVRELLPLVRDFRGGETYGIALGGSHAKGTADAHSDIDIYLFADSVVPAARRAELVAARLGDAAATTWWGADEPFVEGGTDFSADGTRVEVWLRSASAVEAAIEDALHGRLRREHRAWTVMGFFGHVVLGDVHAMRVVDDPAGMLARWKARIATYPEPLREAILHRFLAEAAFWPGNPHYLSAIERGDVIYTTGIVQQTIHALVQVVFALDRIYFPGEKNLAAALAKLPSAPPDFAARVERLLCIGPRPSVADLSAQARESADLVRETRERVVDA